MLVGQDARPPPSVNKRKLLGNAAPQIGLLGVLRHALALPIPNDKFDPSWKSRHDTIGTRTTPTLRCFIGHTRHRREPAHGYIENFEAKTETGGCHGNADYSWPQSFRAQIVSQSMGIILF
jgi:hypothetical protein